MGSSSIIIIGVVAVTLVAGAVYFIGRLIKQMARAGQAQQASEARLKDFAEISSDWFWEMDKNLRFNWFSGHYLEQLGIDVGAYIGKTRREVSAELEDDPHWHRHLEDLDSHRAFENFCYSLDVAGKAALRISINGRPIFDGDRFLGYRGTGSDITEKFEAEERNQQLFAALDAVAEIIALYDANDHLVFANRRYREINAAAAAEHMNSGDAYEPFIRAAVAAGLMPTAEGREETWIAERLEQRRNPTGPFEMLRQDGVWLHVHEQRTEGGGIISVSTDISEVKAAQADLRQAHDELENRVAERTAELTRELTHRERIEQSLKEAIKAAESANGIKTDFLASMSHELRTPLNAVIGFSDAIRHRALGPISEGVYDDYITNIHDSGEHLLALINDILDVSLIEAGQLRLYEEEIDVASVVETCLRMLSPQAETAGLKLEHRTTATMPPLFADERRIKQALINVLSNAIKCTPAEGCVSVELARSATNGMKFIITDTGIGMTKNEIILASTPFGRPRSAAVRDKGGTGLGLPLTLRLVEAHGGRVYIDSTRNLGTTVTLNFPAERIVE